MLYKLNFLNKIFNYNLLSINLMHCLIFTYVLFLCWPLKIGNFKLFEFIAFILVAIGFYANFFKLNLLTLGPYLLFVLMIFLSWSVNLPLNNFSQNVESGLQSAGFYHLSRMIQLFLCFGIFYFFSSLREKNFLKKIINFYVSCLTFICTIALIFYIISFFSQESNYFSKYYAGTIFNLPRMLTPFHPEPNPFGTFLVPSIMVAFFLNRKKSFLLQLVSLAFSFSALAILVLIITFSLYFTKKNLINGVIFLSIILSIIFLYQPLRPVIAWKVEQLIYNAAENSDLGGRYAGMIIAPRMYNDNPLLGIGWQNYRYKRNNPEYLGGAKEILGSNDNPSNDYLKTLAETGIFGFISLMLIICVFMFIILKNIKINNKYSSGSSLATFAIIVALASTSALTFHYLWFWGGITWALYKIESEEKLLNVL